jgi:outer membrane protein insertion porin family
MDLAAHGSKLTRGRDVFPRLILPLIQLPMANGSGMRSKIRARDRRGYRRRDASSTVPGEIPSPALHLEISAAVGVVLLLLAFCAAPIRSQQSQPNSYAGYEGQNVSTVDIAANEATDIEAIRKLITQQTGQPFAMAAIQKSVSALQSTKSFTQVQVSIEPGQSGLRVLFILQPADYVGIVTFPGSAEHFSYVRLLQAVNIPDQSPYVDSLLPPAQEALTKYLREDGYFLASVHPEIHRDETHRVVNIAFNCDLNKRARFGEIKFDGFSDAEAASIRKSLGSTWAKIKGTSLRSGKAYERSRVQKSLDTIRNRLRDEGRMAPVVRFPTPSYDPDTNWADLLFHVEKGPLVSVEVTGAHVSKRTIRRLIPIYDENSVDQDLVDEGQRNLTSYFQSKGFFNAKVDANLKTEPDTVKVVYTVDRGSRHKVEGVYFQGNRFFGDGVLKPHVFVHKGLSLFGRTFSRGNFSEDLLRKSVQSLTALYKNAGFSSVSVTSNVKDYDPAVDVTFQISEGVQDRVNSLHVENNRTETVEKLFGKRPLNLQPGKPYSAQLLDEDRNRVLAAYLNLGYLNADLKATANPVAGNPHLFDVTYTISEGPQARISQIDLLGEEHTRISLRISYPPISSPVSR